MQHETWIAYYYFMKTAMFSFKNIKRSAFAHILFSDLHTLPNDLVPQDVGSDGLSCHLLSEVSADTSTPWTNSLETPAGHAFRQATPFQQATPFLEKHLLLVSPLTRITWNSHHVTDLSPPQVRSFLKVWL